MARPRKEGADAPSPSPSAEEMSPPLPPASPPAAMESASPPPADLAPPASAPASTRRPPPPPPATAGSPPSPPSDSSRIAPPPPPSPSPPQEAPPPSRTAQSPPPPPPALHPPPPPAAATSSTSSLSKSNSPAPLSSPSSLSSTISGTSLVGIGLAGALAFSVLAVLFYCLCRKKKRRHPAGDYYTKHGGQHYKDPYYGVDMRHSQEWCSPSSDALMKTLSSNGHVNTRNGYDSIPSPPPNGGGSSGLGNSKAWFTYHDLANATGGFSKANALGEGGFGCVYKGTLPSGKLVAVKQLKSGASQGEKEFRAEVEIISRVHHRHLVSLVGYCIADRQRLLVYDYVPNGTLEYHLHKKDGLAMDWPTRLKIACGAARGLAYLHEDCHPRIIHRDIKSSNILLDDNFEAQVSDFGLAKLTTDTNTHVTTRVMGTFGYLAPEYASSGKLTDKSDVFSFGVVLLELLTGRKPVDPSQPPGEESLVEWARPVLAQVSGNEDLQAVADPAMEGNFDSRELMRMLEAAAACVRHSANKRPRMGQVVRALEDEGSLSDLNKGLKPGQSGAFGSFASMEYENGSYSADMRKYMKVALDSTQDFGSECSGATSDYGMNASMSSSEFHVSKDMGDRSSVFQAQHPKTSNGPTSDYGRNASMSSSEFHVSRDMGDRSSVFQAQHPKTSNASTRADGGGNMSMEMGDQSFILQHHHPKPLRTRANLMAYNTQEFRLGSQKPSA